MWKRTLKRLMMVVTFALALLETAPLVQGEEIRVASGFIPVNDASKPFQQDFERVAGVTLSFANSEIDQLLLDLKQGALDAVAGNLPMEEFLEGFRRYEGKAGGDLFRSATIAQIPLAVVVAKTNPVTRLSKSQLKGIFTGKITSWDEVGGAKMPISPIMPWGYPTRSFFRYLIMDGEAYAPVVRDAGMPEDDLAPGKPGTIAAMPAIRVDNSVKVVAAPDITMTFSLITMGEPSPKVQKLIDFSRGSGKKYLRVDRK